MPDSETTQTPPAPLDAVVRCPLVADCQCEVRDPDGCTDVYSTEIGCVCSMLCWRSGCVEDCPAGIKQAIEDESFIGVV